MTKRHNTIVIGVAFIISIVILAVSFNKQHSQSVFAKTFEGPNGWGYDIWVHDTLFIHQEFIPTVGEKKGFSEKRLAEKASGLVVQKLQQNKLPTLTKFDIERICSPGN